MPKLLLSPLVFAKSSSPFAREEDGEDTTHSSASQPHLPEVLVKMDLHLVTRLKSGAQLHPVVLFLLLAVTISARRDCWQKQLDTAKILGLHNCVIVDYCKCGLALNCIMPATDKHGIL